VRESGGADSGKWRCAAQDPATLQHWDLRPLVLPGSAYVFHDGMVRACAARGARGACARWRLRVRALPLSSRAAAALS
jgi:hypothetical protein